MQLDAICGAATLTVIEIIESDTANSYHGSNECERRAPAEQHAEHSLNAAERPQMGRNNRTSTHRIHQLCHDGRAWRIGILQRDVIIPIVFVRNVDDAT